MKEARDVLDLMQQEYGLVLEKEVKVFVYADEQDYRSAFGPLQVSSTAVTVGTDRIFMLLALLPEENSQAIRHEVLHAVFLQRTENALTGPRAGLPRDSHCSCPVKRSRRRILASCVNWTVKGSSSPSDR